VRVDGRDTLSGVVIESAVLVHRSLGPGLLESVYQSALAYELGKRGVPFAANCRLPVWYDGVELRQHFRLDLLVAEQLVVELKSVQELHPIHTAQLLTYLKLSGHKRGLLINFNVARLVSGVRRLSL
jgi:GxxExxY protein